MRMREGRPTTWGWPSQLKKPPSAYMPSNSSDQISQTSSWLQMPLPTGGTELNRKKGASLLHQAVGNSTSGPWGVSWQYGRSVSRALL